MGISRPAHISDSSASTLARERDKNILSSWINLLRWSQSSLLLQLSLGPLLIWPLDGNHQTGIRSHKDQQNGLDVLVQGCARGVKSCAELGRLPRFQIWNGCSTIPASFYWGKWVTWPNPKSGWGMNAPPKLQSVFIIWASEAKVVVIGRNNSDEKGNLPHSSMNS